MNTNVRCLCAILLVLVLGFTACTTNQVVSNLEAAISAAEVAVPIVAGAAGLPAGTITLISNYLSAAGTALSQASTILGNGAVTPAQVSQIVSLFAQAVAPVLPPGTPQVVVTAVQAVAAAITNFLKSIGAQSALLKASSTPVKVPSSYKARLASDRVKAEQVVVAAQALKH